MSDKGFPDVIINTPSNRRVLAELFSYEARVYDLNEYEAIAPGAGLAIWKCYKREEEHQKRMDVLKARLEKADKGWLGRFGF
jgi:hypothetical protein